VPIDDNTTVSFSFETVYSERWQALRLPERRPPEYPMRGDDGLERNLANKFLIDRDLQKDGTIFTGIADHGIQDVMARQTSFTDRTKEHLGSLDRKIIFARRLLINAAKNLEKGIEPPAIDPSLPYDKVAWYDKVLREGEDWTSVGTEADPDYNRVYGTPAIAEPPMQATS
jgi:hypothetical protein